MRLLKSFLVVVLFETVCVRSEATTESDVDDEQAPIYWKAVLGDICQLPNIPRPSPNPKRYLECIRPKATGGRNDLGIWVLSECIPGYNFVTAAKRCKSTRAIRRQQAACVKNPAQYSCPQQTQTQVAVVEIRLPVPQCPCQSYQAQGSSCTCQQQEIFQPQPICGCQQQNQQCSTPCPAPQPQPQPQPQPYCPCPQPGPQPQPCPNPCPMPYTPQPQPLPTPQPYCPCPQPGPQPCPNPCPAPRPQPRPQPQPQPYCPCPQPGPQPCPNPCPAPQPQPQPTPYPYTTPYTQPTYTPYTPTPYTQPTYAPYTPQPQPQPQPQQPRPCPLATGNAQSARENEPCSWMMDPLAVDPTSPKHFLQCQPAPYNDVCGRWRKMPCEWDLIFDVQMQVCIWDPNQEPGQLPPAEAGNVVPDVITQRPPINPQTRQPYSPGPTRPFSPGPTRPFSQQTSPPTQQCGGGCPGGIQIGVCTQNYQCPGQSVCQKQPIQGGGSCGKCCYTVSRKHKRSLLKKS